MSTFAVPLPPELRPRLVAQDDRLFGRLLSGCLLVALVGSSLIGLRVVPIEPPPSEPPRIVREFVLPLPLPTLVEVALTPTPVAPPLAATPTPTGPAARPPGPPRSIDELGLIAVLGHEGALGSVLDDGETPGLEAALEDSTRARSTASAGPAARGEETGRAATIGDLGLAGAPAKIELVERPSSLPRPSPPPPRIELQPSLGEDPGPSITQLIKQRLPAIRRCYEKAIARDRGLKGRLVLRFSVDEGRVEALELETTTLASISTCVRAVVRSTPFPRELSSGPIELPIVFLPSGD